jgi:hypothetical protein
MVEQLGIMADREQRKKKGLGPLLSSKAYPQ